MPDKKFLEEYPLYRKFKFPESLSNNTRNFPKPPINMVCSVCQSNQTYVMTDDYEWQSLKQHEYGVYGQVFTMGYLCSHCNTFLRTFCVKIDDNGQSMMKVGQYPAWEIKSDANIEQLLGEHAGYYKKGLVCESQGYGIGAFGYYRRIVEEIIDGLLDEIGCLLSDDELTKYQEALSKTKQTTVTQEKIDLVKDLLPSILRPEGMNPLSVLHSALSEGLHANSDDECLEYAETCREILVFLVNQIVASKAASKGITESMRKLLEKKSKKSS